MAARKILLAVAVMCAGFELSNAFALGVPSVLPSLCLAPSPSDPSSEGRLLGWHCSSTGPSREALRARPVVWHGH